MMMLILIGERTMVTKRTIGGRKAKMGMMKKEKRRGRIKDEDENASYEVDARR